MVIDRPTGNQIAFFVVVAWLLMVPASRFLERALDMPPMASEPFGRYFTVFGPALLFIAIPRVRHACIEALRTPVGIHRTEVAIVSLLYPLHFFAFAGAYALWWNAFGGPEALRQQLSGLDSGAHAMRASLQPAAIAIESLFAVMLGPIVEELLFRRFAYRAWEARYGWMAALFLSASLFAVLHANFLPAFIGGVVFATIYRRTGSLRAAILVHAAGNLAAAYPLLGRFVWRRGLPDPGDLAYYTWHVMALIVVALLCPLYVWMSRESREVSGTCRPCEESTHAALPR